MKNIFISAIENFKKNLYTENAQEEFYPKFEKYKYVRENGELFWFNKKHKKTLKELLATINNEEYRKILSHIYTPSPEESEFYNWITLINEFMEFITNYADPLFYNNEECSVKIGDGKVNSLIFTTIDFKFTITFEKSNIRKTENFSLFDSITGLDKGKNLIFIKISIENLISKKVYNYEYIEGGSITNNTGIDDDICDMQLKIVKDKLNDYMVAFVEDIFDSVLNNEFRRLRLADCFEYFKVFNGAFLVKSKEIIYGDIWREWIGAI